MNAAEQMFGMRENGERDPLHYNGHVDEPQEVVRMLAELVPVGSPVLEVNFGIDSVARIIADTRDATNVGVEPNSCRAAAARARGLEAHQERSRRLRLEGKVLFHRAFGQRVISAIRKLRRQILRY